MSRPTEAIQSPDLIFKGTDGSECEAFVAAIRNHAFESGRDEDFHWMLRFATARLRGKALRWHARLDPSIKNDWDLFVQALFDQYPSVEEAINAAIAAPVWPITTFSPGPSTATLPLNSGASRSVSGRSLPIVPRAQAGREESRDSYVSKERASSSRQYDVSGTGQQVGLLRLVNEQEPSIPQYLWWDNSDSRSATYRSAMATVNRHDAIVVSFLPSSTPHTIGCLNSSGALKTLAISWVCAPETEYYHIYGCASNRITTPEKSTSGNLAKAWNLLADGTLQASLSSWSQNSANGVRGKTEFTTSEVHVNISGDIIRFVKPGALLEQDRPESSHIHPFVRARIVFEPL